MDLVDAFPNDIGRSRWRLLAVRRFAGWQPAIQPIANRRYSRIDHFGGIGADGPEAYATYRADVPTPARLLDLGAALCEERET